MTDELETAPLPAPFEAPAAVVALGPVGEPVPAARPEPAQDVAAKPSEVAAAPAGGRHPKLGLAAEIVGVVGIVVFLALAVGIVLGRGWAVSTMDDLAAGVDSRVAKVVPMLDTASGKVSEVSGRLGAVADIAQSVADSPSPAQAILQKLLTEVTNVSDRYMALRTSYADARDTIVGIIDRLQTMERFIPGFSVPQGAVDKLAAVDAKVRELDAAIMGITGALPQDGAVNQAAGTIADKVGKASTTLDALSTTMSEAKQRLVDLRAEIKSKVDTLRTAITLGSFALVLLCAWIAVLHWVLFRTGRQLRRGAAAA
jgi:hypothetical protein